MADHANKVNKPAPASIKRSEQGSHSPDPQSQIARQETPEISRNPQPQAKIKIGKSDDPAEAEADRVAQNVVQNYQPSNHSGSNSPSPAALSANFQLPAAHRQVLQNWSVQKSGEEEVQSKTAEEKVSAKEDELANKEEEVQGKEEEMVAKEELQEKEEEVAKMEELQGKEEEVQGKEEEMVAKEELQEKEEEVQGKEEETAAKQEEAQMVAEVPAVLPMEEEVQPEEDEMQPMEGEEQVAEKADPLGEVQTLTARREEEEEVQREETEIQEQPEPEPEAEVQKAPELIQEEEEEEAQPKGVNQGGGEASAQTEREIRQRDGAGQPLPDPTRGQMEAGIGASFADIRVHTDPAAAALSQQLGARAFAFGRNVFFGAGEFNPGTPSGDFLIAHELAHTVQQGAAPKFLSKSATPEEESDGSIQASFRDVLDALLDAADFLGINVSRIVDNIPGYTLFSYVIEYDVIRGRSVDQDMQGLIRGLMGLVPFGNLAYEKLNEYGLIERAATFIENELSRLNLSMGRIENTISSAWDEMGVSLGIDGNLRVLDRHFTPLYNDVVSFAESASSTILELVKEAVVRPLVGFLEENSPAYVLATKVIGSKFPLEDEVEAPTVDILKDFLILIGKETEVAEMEEKGTLQETADWIDTQLSRFFSLLGRFNAIVTRVWNAFTLETLADLPGVFQSVWTDFTELLQDFLDFALEVAAKVLELIKISLLEWLAGFANEVPGFHLMTVLIGTNPFTGAVVERTTKNIIRGFMGLVPGGEAKFQQLEETGVVSQAASKIDALIAELGISVDMIVGIFTGIWEGMSIDDLLNPIDAFQRIVDQFGEPIVRLFTFVVKVVVIVVELILRMMNFPIDLIGEIIANVQAAFEKIKEDPVQFLLNMIAAIKQGFSQFFGNIVTHLINGLQTWLFGTLAEGGITVPQDLSLQSILGMAMEVLGITVDNVLERLALKIGQERVDQIRGVLDTLTGIWTFVKDVIERGPIAIWEYVVEKLNDLWSMIMGAIQEWIMTRIITAVTTKILSMLDPTGIMAVINSAIAFYNAVMSFIEKLTEILEIVNTFVKGVLDIANGNLTTAANFLEQALADGIPVAISFLARQVGLGGLSDKISEMIEAAREKINEAIDWLIDKALEAGTAFLQMLGIGGEEEEASGDQPEGAQPGDEVLHLTFGTEDHHIRATMTETGEMEVLMASEQEENIRRTILTIRDEYMNRVPSGDQNNFIQKMNDTADYARQELATINQRYPRSREDSPQRKTDISDYLEEVGGMLEEIAEEFQIQTLEGLPQEFKVNDEIYDKGNNERLIVYEAYSRDGTQFKLRAHPVNDRRAIRDFDYASYGTAWEKVDNTAKPTTVKAGGYGSQMIIADYPISGGEAPKGDFPKWKDYSPKGTYYGERGHLIAKMFGGKGGKDNIVAMTASANDLMQSNETRVRNWVQKGHVFEYKITMSPVARERTGPTAGKFLPPKFVYAHIKEIYPGNANHPNFGAVHSPIDNE